MSTGSLAGLLTLSHVFIDSMPVEYAVGYAAAGTPSTIFWSRHSHRQSMRTVGNQNVLVLCGSTRPVSTVASLSFALIHNACSIADPSNCKRSGKA